MGQLFACCKDDGKIGVFLRKGLKFCKDGLGKLGKIFKKSFSGSRNTKPNPHQEEIYENPNEGVYKPGFYSIKPKAVDEQFDDNNGRQDYEVNYTPVVDPNKKPKTNLGKLNFGFGNGLNKDDYRKKKKKKLEDKNKNNANKDILKVKEFLTF
jgi:hypothetical protein